MPGVNILGSCLGQMFNSNQFNSVSVSFNINENISASCQHSGDAFSLTPYTIYYNSYTDLNGSTASFSRVPGKYSVGYYYPPYGNFTLSKYCCAKYLYSQFPTGLFTVGNLTKTENYFRSLNYEPYSCNYSLMTSGRINFDVIPSGTEYLLDMSANLYAPGLTNDSSCSGTFTEFWGLMLIFPNVSSIKGSHTMINLYSGLDPICGQNYTYTDTCTITIA